MKSIFLMAMAILLPATANASLAAVVPEPASLVLFATGVVGLGVVAVARRRKK